MKQKRIYTDNKIVNEKQTKIQNKNEGLNIVLKVESPTFHKSKVNTSR